MNNFTKLDENGDGRSVFAYDGIIGEIKRNGGDVHIRIEFGASELNFMCEDASAFLDVCSELLLQDSKWHEQAIFGKEPF